MFTASFNLGGDVNVLGTYSTLDEAKAALVTSLNEGLEPDDEPLTIDFTDQPDGGSTGEHFNGQFLVTYAIEQTS